MALPNPYRDGSYDPGATPATQAQGTQGMLQIAAKTNPGILQDPSIAGALNPEQLQQALQTYLKLNDPSYDPNNLYAMKNGQAVPNTGSWWSDNLPWITALMGIGMGGASAFMGGVSGGADAVGSVAGEELGPSTTANIAATTAATTAPEGIAASGIPVAAGGTAAAGATLGPTTPATMAGTSSAGAAPSGIAATTAGKAMDPMTMYLLMSGISAATSAYGASQQAGAQNNANQQNALDFQQGRGDQMSQAVANFLNGQMTLNNQQANQGLMSTQLDPYAQAKALNNANIKRSFAQGWNPTTGMSGSFDTSALDPSNLAASKTQFDQYAGAASPNVPINNDPTAENFRQSYQTQQSALQTQIMQYLRNIGVYNGSQLSTLYPQGDPANSAPGGLVKPNPYQGSPSGLGRV